jgi:transcriptional regulator with XRE-family HTH domain
MPIKIIGLPENGAVMKRHRERLGVTLQELADEIGHGMHKSTVHRWESGKRRWEDMHPVWVQEYMRALGYCVLRNQARKAVEGNPIIKAIRRRTKKKGAKKRGQKGIPGRE